MTQTPLTPSLIARVSQAARYVITGDTPAAWFGPMQPLAPIAPAEVAGRRFDYPVGYNLNSSPRSAEPVSFGDLRALADNCDILRSVIETRKDQMEALQWNIRLLPTDANASYPTSDQQNRINAIRQFLQCPDRESGFSGWLRQILEDMFVIDAACIYKRMNRAGGLYALEVIDGATVKILIDDAGRLPAAPDPAYQQVLKGVPAADYSRDELIYLKHNPRSNRIYGYSHVEQVMITVNILIRRALHQLEYYRDGSQPDAFIGLPKEWNQEQIVAFQKHFDAMLAGNSAMRRRLRFMPGDFKYQETKAPLLKDVYDEFLARIICYVFSVSPEPFVSHVNRATAQTSQKRASDEGLAPLQRYVSDFINRIIATDFASPDLEFVWQDANEQDPQQAAAINVAYVQAGILSVDEVRHGLGLAPVVKEKVAQVGKLNPYHKPAGHPDGGQFATGGGTQGFADMIASGMQNPVDMGRYTQVAANGNGGSGGAMIDGYDPKDPFKMAPQIFLPISPLSGIGAAAEVAVTAGEAATATEEAATNAAENLGWKLGDFKSQQRWDNQMANRGWTNEQIDDTIATGEQFPAPNFVNKANSAMRYVNPTTGKYIVKDNSTNEILQLGGDNFEPPVFPSK